MLVSLQLGSRIEIVDPVALGWIVKCRRTNCVNRTVVRKVARTGQ